MVQEAIDGLTDQQLADLELQESGLVSGQNAGAIAYTPFAQRMNPQPAPAPEPEEPVALSEFQLNQLEEENYRRMDYVMTPQEFDQYWDRRDKEDREVGRFFEGLGQGAAGLIGMVPETGRELQGAMVGMVTDPVNQVQRNVQTGAEIIRKGGINLVQLFDWVGSKVDDLATGSKRAEAINAGIMDRLIADGKVTGDREQDEQIYQAALAEAREAGAYTPTLDQAREDKGKAYERYVREKALERDFANVSEFKTGQGQMSVPTSAGTYQITDEQPMPTISTLGSMVVDPLNALPLGAGALSKARVLRRIANLSEKPLMVGETAANVAADAVQRAELALSSRIQDFTGLTQTQQAALGAGVAGTAVYVDAATDSGGGLAKAVLMAGGIMPALHWGGGLLRKVGSAAGGAATIVREAGVGGLGVARAEAASSLAGNAAVPERYRKFFTGYVDGTDSTLKRVAQDAGNPEALRRGARFADRMGATQVARAADDAVSGAVTAGIVGSPFAALQPDAERAGEVMGGILALGGVGGLAGGVARRAGTAADADIARMFADVQAVGGNVEAFARLPHATLDRLSAMQGVLAGKVDFVPLTGDEYRMNADIAQNGGEATAGVFLDRDANNRARVFINLDGKTATDAIAPHEIGHAILTSNILDGQPRNDLRNLVNQQYGPGGVESRGREYIARMVDADLRQGVTGEAPTVLTDAEMKAMDGGKTMDDIVADRAKDPAERDRLINERVEEFRQRSIDKGEDALDWARDEIIAETFASEAPAIDFRAIRRDAMFPRLAESMLSAGGRVLEVMGARLDPGTGKLMDNPSVLFRDNPLFQDRIMQKRVREYVRSYDQYLAGLEEAGAKELRGVELARSSKPEDLARSTHVKLRDEGNGVLENDFMVQRPDGTYTMKAQKTVSLTENARSAQIKTLYDARKFVPVNSQEFGKRKVNGREVVGGPVLPPQFDFFTNFPKHVREFARSMEQSRAEGGSWDIDYNAIGTGASGRYRVTNLGNVRAIQRETVPFGWQVTKANHLLAASLDLNAFRASAMKAINKGDLGLFNNDMRQVEADLKTYLANHRNGRPGEMTIGQQKRDMLNGLIGTGTAVQRTANPLYSDLNPRGSIRTWRVDRLNDAKPTGRTGYFFDYDKINNNRMPSALPQAGMAMPDAAPVRTLDTDRLLREYEENQGYLGLSTMGMREGRPVRGGAAETRRLLARNTEISRELDARGVKTEDAQLQRALAKRKTGQAMPDTGDRKAVQQEAKRLGLPATGTTKEIANLVGVAAKDPYTWTREEFDSIAPHLSIHQDIREGSDARVAQTMERGLSGGMVDSVGAWRGGRMTWSGGKMAGNNAYLFISGGIKYRKGNLNPWLDEGNMPIAHLRTQPGQTDIYESLQQGKATGGTRGQAMPDVSDIDTAKYTIAYRGGPSGKGDFPGTFVSTSQEAASQYGDVRAVGVPRGLKVLSIDDDAALQLARQYEKKYPADALNDDLAAGDEPIDLFMFPRPEWTQMLKQKGYQATQVGEDLFVFDGVKLSDKQAAVAARGQAMPDVGEASDQGVAMPKGTVTQLTNVARKALPRLPRGASNVPKVVVQVQRRGKPKMVKTIAGEKLVPGEMKKPKDIVVDGGDSKNWNGYTGEYRMPLPNIKLDKTKGVSWSKQDIYDVAQTDRARAQANAQQSVQAAAMAAADPLKFVDPVGYSEIMRASGVAGDILIPPSGLKLMLTDPKAFVGLLDGGFHGKRTVPGTRAAAMQGLDGVTEMRQLVGGQPSSFNTALHHFWGTLSKQLDVINQEAAWMRLMLDPEIIEAIDQSISGKFSMQVEDWEALVAKALDSTQGDFRGKGNNAKSNANSFYNALVYHNGRWDEVAALYANNNAIDMRAQFNALGHGKVGMKNKVQGFVGLSFGVKGSVLDRWRFVDLYLPDVMGLTGAATPEQYFKYVGESKVIPQDPIGIYKNYGTIENDSPAFSLALYNSLDSVAQVAINNSPELRNYLGAHADPGGLHWVTWNSIKNEAVGHSSLDITKNFVRKYGRNGTASDFAQFMRTAEGFVEGSNDAGQTIRLSLKNGVFNYLEQ